jgi:hypothetical protein
LTFARIVQALQKLDADVTEIEKAIARKELAEVVDLFVKTLEPEPKRAAS